MFKNYYGILEIGQEASPEEIKSAFKKQALKWHPDKNPNIDTTSKMQAINEAKLILLDLEARMKYDKEFNRYQDEKRKQEENQKNEDTDYRIHDEELYRWMNNAKRQSVDLAKKTIEDFKGMVVAGTKAAAKEAIGALTVQIIIGIIISFLFLISRACNS
jgi:curved DNA-binding protein CbpA